MVLVSDVRAASSVTRMPSRRACWPTPSSAGRRSLSSACEGLGGQLPEQGVRVAQQVGEVLRPARRPAMAEAPAKLLVVGLRSSTFV